MQIQINTDSNIDGNEALAAYIRGETEQALNRFNEHITRVEVHLSDENSDKKGGKDSMKCVMEARLERRHPLAASQHATTLNQAVTGAVQKLAKQIESTLGRTGNQRGHHIETPQYGLEGLDEVEEV